MVQHLRASSGSRSRRTRDRSATSRGTRSAGPASTATDLSLFKNFALSGAQQLQLRVEAFNVFNQERFGQPGNTLGAATFGAITSADDGRIVQLGIKYTF